MTVKEIISKWLKDNGYDGLYNEECGCELDDLMPCEGSFDMFPISKCSPGYKSPCVPEECDLDGDCPFHIGERKDND